MHVTATLLATLTAFSSVLAAASTLEKKECQRYSYLPNLNIIAQRVPTSSTPITQSPFTVAKDIGRKDLVASFRNIPGDAAACTLQLDYAGLGSVTKIDGDPTLINVWRLADGGNFPYSPTWENTDARQEGLIGNFHFPQGDAQFMSQVIDIAPVKCDAIMTFRFSIADDVARGTVSHEDSQNIGLRIAYNC